MNSATWKLRLERFFYERGEAVRGVPTLFKHCIVSAKDPRIAAQPDFHRDLINSLLDQLGLDHTSSVLEVGCASGYIACGLAPRVGQYLGVDLVATPLIVARSIGLTNATFRQADGEELPFEDYRFDAAFAYDVFSNFPSFSDIVPLLAEMVRVVRPGGRLMAGSITDASRAEEFQQHVYAVAAKLDKDVGPAVPPPPPPSRFTRLVKLFKRRIEKLPPPPPVEAQVTNYNFEKSDFCAFAKENGLTIQIFDVHQRNPYLGYRYNIVLTKPVHRHEDCLSARDST